MLTRVCLKALVIVLTALWGACALWYPSSFGSDARLAMVVAWLVITLAALYSLFWRVSPKMLWAYFLVFAGILMGWLMLPPSNQRQWTDDLARMTTAEVRGNHVMLRNVRDFDWHSDTNYREHWDVRNYDLDQLAGVDMLLSYWDGPAIAHTLVSFGFRDGRQVVFSVEVRKEQGEAFSELGGFFKHFELSVVAADERDIVRVRTNVRGEDVYLYRIALSPEARRALFLAYAEAANQLAVQPRFYNTLSTNCTTLVYAMMKHIEPDLPFDYRLLVSGYLPSYVQEVGGLDSRYTLAQLRRMGRITDRARAAGDAVDFSTQIRRGIPELPE